MVRDPSAPGPGSSVRVVVVAHGPPMRGGIPTVALDLVEDPELREEFDMVFFNTSQNDDQRGEFGVANVVRAAQHAWGTFTRSRPGAVVHTHSVQDPVFVAWRQVAIALAARARGARVLLHNHAYRPYMTPPGQWRVGPAHRMAFRLLDVLCDANILLAEAGRPNLRPLMPHTPLPVVNNSVVVSDFEQSTPTHEPPVVLFVGEMLERKGVLVLLDALDALDARGVSGFELRLVGDNTVGVSTEKDAVIAEIGARGRAHAMTGPVDPEEVRRHMAEADVFVLPTFVEGQPFAVIESLAAGVPIVASNIPSIADVVTDSEHGRLVPVGDAAVLADAIEALLADPAERRRIGAANRALATERFDRSVFRERIARLYRLHGRPSRSALRRSAGQRGGDSG